MITLEFLNSLEQLLANKDIQMQVDCVQAEIKDLAEFISECNRYHKTGYNQAFVTITEPHPDLHEVAWRYWNNSLSDERARLQRQGASGYIVEIDTVNYKFPAVYHVGLSGEIRRL